MDIIGSTIVTLFLLLGLFVTTRDAGYSFDLRRRRSRPVIGGRRASDI